MRRRRQGAAIISVLFFSLILSMLLMGTGWYAASSQQRSVFDRRYTQALDLAEAGINFEFQKISANPSNADQFPGGTYSFGQGTFKVYCSNLNGTTPWTPSQYLLVTCTGTVEGVSRTVRASVKGYNLQGRYAIYGINRVDLQGNVQVLGDVGSNGAITQIGSVDITGSIYLNGPSASYSGPKSPYVNPQPLNWDTVDEKALALFPNSGATAPGGLAYLRFHNNNAAVGLPSDGNTAVISNDITLVGPGDYYVSEINLTGHKQVRFDNRNGPIRLWVGPAGSTGNIKMRGTTDATTDETVGGHQVDIYVAKSSPVDMAGTSTLRANVYVYNKDVNGVGYGSIENSGTPDVYGSMLAYNVTLKGTPTTAYVQGLDLPPNNGYYGYYDSWLEINPR